MQIFPRTLNWLPVVVFVAFNALGAGATFLVWYYFSPSNTQVGYAPAQPVPYSHRLHAGQLGIDCRYCHAQVERAAHAMVPATQTCMGCHAVIKKQSARLEAIRESWRTQRPVQWVRVHKLPDHAFFDHSVHLSAGVGCATCHGRIDEMEVVRQAQPLSMGWCLECHRNPEPNLRPVSEITNMAYSRADSPDFQPAREVHPPTHCSGCHR